MPARRSSGIYARLNKAEGGGALITISIASNKGGVGKSSTACFLAYMLKERGKKVLLIDMDSQGNATRTYGITPKQYNTCIYHLFLDQIRKSIGNKPLYKIRDTIIKTEFGVDLLPSDNRLSEIPTWLQANGSKFKTGAEIEKLWKNNFPWFLTNILQDVDNKYDRVIIDTPPAFEYNTKTALLASNYVIIPVELGDLEVAGAENMYIRINNFKNSHKAGRLIVLGVLKNRFENRANVEKGLDDELNNHPLFGNIVFNTVIYRNTAVKEAAVLGKLAVLHKKKGARSVKEDYYNFAEEVELRLEKHRRAAAKKE